MAIGFIFFLFSCQNKKEKEPSSSDKNCPEYYEWEEGFFDIHTINTGRGNAMFFIFPDGTNLLYDAGCKLKSKKENPDWKQHMANIHPNDSKMAGAWIAHYIKKILPENQEPRIDYAVISHFHVDHFGEVDSSTVYAPHQAYKLTGITEVGYSLPIKKLLDRGYPNYDYPVDLNTFYTSNSLTDRYRSTLGISFVNYLKFIEYEVQNNGLKCEAIQVGSNEQIKLVFNPENYKNFKVRNLKSNQIYWSGNETETFEYEFPEPLFNKELNTYNENPLSIALKFSYGDFDFLTAGDIAGINGFPNFDMETPLGEVVGQVEVMTLNHHGAHDSCNEAYLKATNPKLMIHQALHGNHFNKQVIQRIKDHTNAKILTRNTDDRVKEEIGSLYDDVFLNQNGHILIRVYPNGEKFEAYTLDDNSEEIPILKKIGTYKNYN